MFVDLHAHFKCAIVLNEMFLVKYLGFSVGCWIEYDSRADTGKQMIVVRAMIEEQGKRIGGLLLMTVSNDTFVFFTIWQYFLRVNPSWVVLGYDCVCTSILTLICFEVGKR